MRNDFPLMLFAAGFGTRMGALTATRPKPLIPVQGRALIDHALALADEAGVTRRVANAHYLADQVALHLSGTGTEVSREDPILDTAGGLRAALPLLGPGPVMTLNTDAVWTGANPLRELDAAWDGARMDALLLLLPAGLARSQTGRSDFVMDAAGHIDWARGREGYLYLGAQIVDPRLLPDLPPGPVPMRAAWDRWIAAGRAFGIVHEGDWCDVGHPGGLAEAEAMLAGAHG
ncbi:MAG: nucleotidyltransferase family protein [Paracoccaceae bacterium]